MDVVGGVIVAAGAQKDDRRGACRGRVKRGRCGSDYGSETMVEEPAAWSSFHHRKKQGAGSVTGVTSAAEVDRHEDYELRNALRLYRPAANPPFLTKSAPLPPLLTRSWVDPLRLLLKKELTVTDVGDLGRIILPKRDAECQLPHLDSKEGQLLSMEDYNSTKNWTLRYKWWPNNKSRMYVLESTGEFVKHYDLKEKDELIVYKDGIGNLVIRGRKCATSPIEIDTFMGSSSTKGTTPTGKRSPKGANNRSHLSKSGNSSNLSSTFVPTLTTTTTTTSLQLSTSMLTTSMLSTASSIFTTNNHVEGSLLNHPATIVGPYGAVAVQIDHGTCIDWAKLPDPPAIEFSDPPAIEFADEFECTWGACI